MKQSKRAEDVWCPGCYVVLGYFMVKITWNNKDKNLEYFHDCSMTNTELNNEC